MSKEPTNYEKGVQIISQPPEDLPPPSYTANIPTPQVPTAPVISPLKEDFTYGLFSCFGNIPVTILSCCCQPISLAAIAQKLWPDSCRWFLVLCICLICPVTVFILTVQSPIRDDPFVYDIEGIGSYLYLGGSLITTFLIFYLRRQTRSKNNIKKAGHINSDFCASLCCSCCVTVQIGRENKLLGGE